MKLTHWETISVIKLSKVKLSLTISSMVVKDVNFMQTSLNLTMYKLDYGQKDKNIVNCIFNNVINIRFYKSNII